MPERPSTAERLTFVCFWIVVGLTGGFVFVVLDWDDHLAGVALAGHGWPWALVALVAGWGLWLLHRGRA
jgi:hypothetical protein